MPYCNLCGNFENVLDFRKICNQCAHIPLDRSSRDVNARQQRQIMRSNTHSKFLYYPVKIHEIVNSPLFEQEPNNTEPVSSNSSLPNSRLPSLIPHSLRDSLIRQFNVPAHLPIRSQMALITAILGWVFFFFQNLFFLSIFFQTFALIMALRARRSEPRNKLYILALILSISNWIIIIAVILIQLSDPELIAMLNQQMEEQMG